MSPSEEAGFPIADDQSEGAKAGAIQRRMAERRAVRRRGEREMLSGDALRRKIGRIFGTVLSIRVRGSNGRVERAYPRLEYIHSITLGEMGARQRED